MRRFAFFIGIDNYSNDIAPLTCAAQDAKVLFSKFSAAGFENPVLLLNEEAASSRILEELKKLCSRISADDLLVFYFAGHGRELNGEHYLVGKDGHASANLYSVGSLPMSGLLELTGKTGARRFFILDCCRDNLLAGRSASYLCENSRTIALDNAVRQQSGTLTRPPLILNSCSAGEKAFEDRSSGHGFFTKNLLAVMNNRAIKDFAAFRKALKTNMLSAVNQNISWNGDPDSWDDVPLFSNWDAPDPAAAAASSVPEKNFPEHPAAKLPEAPVLPQTALPAQSVLKKIKIALMVFILLAAAVISLRYFFSDPERREKRAGTERDVSADHIRVATVPDDELLPETVRIPEFPEKFPTREDVPVRKMPSARTGDVLILSADGTVVTGVKADEREDLVSVTIPPTVKIIGAHAFDGCSELSEIFIPVSVQMIGGYAFKDCSALEKLRLPPLLTSIGEGAFKDCSALEEIVIPRSVRSVGQDIFDGCSALARVYMPRHLRISPESLPEDCHIYQQ